MGTDNNCWGFKASLAFFNLRFLPDADVTILGFSWNFRLYYRELWFSIIKTAFRSCVVIGKKWAVTLLRHLILHVGAALMLLTLTTTSNNIGPLSSCYPLLWATIKRIWIITAPPFNSAPLHSVFSRRHATFGHCIQCWTTSQTWTQLWTAAIVLGRCHCAAFNIGQLWAVVIGPFHSIVTVLHPSSTTVALPCHCVLPDTSTAISQ